MSLSGRLCATVSAVDARLRRVDDLAVAEVDRDVIVRLLVVGAVVEDQVTRLRPPLSWEAARIAADCARMWQHAGAAAEASRWVGESDRLRGLAQAKATGKRAATVQL